MTIDKKYQLMAMEMTLTLVRPFPMKVEDVAGATRRLAKRRNNPRRSLNAVVVTAAAQEEDAASSPMLVSSN